MRRLLFAAPRIDFLQTVRRGLHQAKTDAVAAIFQLPQPLCLTFLPAPVRHGHVDDVPFRFAQQPQRQPADDYLVIRVRRENQDLRRVREDLRTGQRGESAERMSLSLSGNAGVFRDEVMIGIHPFVISGKLAAATACPTRLLFSSARWSESFCARSGKSARKTSLAFCTMRSPPAPEVTRPSTSTW